MVNLNVSYEEMHSEANELRRAKEDIEGQLTQLASRIDGLVTSGFVTDSASGAFQEMYNNFTTSAKNTISSLEQIAGTLSQMATTMQETDQQMANQIR